MILRSLTIKLEYMIDPMFLLPKVLTHDRSVHEKNLGWRSAIVRYDIYEVKWPLGKDNFLIIKRHKLDFINMLTKLCTVQYIKEIKHLVV